MQHAGLDPFFFPALLPCPFFFLLVRDEKGTVTIQPGSLTAMQQQQQRAFATSACPACFDSFPPSSHPGWRNFCLERKGTETETVKKQAKIQGKKKEQTKRGREVGFLSSTSTRCLQPHLNAPTFVCDISSFEVQSCGWSDPHDGKRVYRRRHLVG